MRDAFRFYVEHERDIRRRLQEHRNIGKPLNEWRRAFFLDTGLSPTRRQVLSLDYRQDTIADDWFWPKVPHGTNDLLDANRRPSPTLYSSLHGRRLRVMPAERLIRFISCQKTYLCDASMRSCSSRFA